MHTKGQREDFGPLSLKLFTDYCFDLQALALWPFIGLPHVQHFSGCLALFSSACTVLEVACKTSCSSATETMKKQWAYF